MDRRILPRLGARVVFVVGKGGVGKSTTAGALALAMAEEGDGADVHLLSTDPAHSVGDLFGADLEAGTPTPSPCTPRLILEELHAASEARRWTERGRKPILELFDLGTWLDARDVEAFLDLTLPGVDEVAAMLRLTELADADPGRIVVDTAPTGHTLRLLDAGDTVASWERAFDAMGEKGEAVASGLLRRSVRLGARDFLDELAGRVRTFQDGVLASGEAVVVTRSGSVVAAETERLVDALGERGLSVALRVRTGEPGETGEAAPSPSPDEVFVPFRPELEGCEGLRSWGDPLPGREAGSRDGRPERPAEMPGAEAAEAAEAAEELEGDVASLLEGLRGRLILVVGKGGVGKSTCAAAVALHLAGSSPEGPELRLLSTDPAGSLDDVLPDTRGGMEIEQVRARERFDALREAYRDDVEAAFRRAGMEGSVLDRRVVSSLLDLAPPGLDEIFALLALLEREEGGGGPRRNDSSRRTRVVDTAPTGHLVRLLSMPELAYRWTRELLGLLRRYRAGLQLDAFAERLLTFARELRELQEELRDPGRTAALVVTQPGPLVQAETRRLLARLEEASIPVAAVIANRWPSDPSDASDGGGRSPELPGGPETPALAAPTLERPPVGEDDLRRFLTRWRRVR